MGKPVFPRSLPLGKLRDLVQQGKRPEIPGNVSLNIKRIIKQYWAVDPDIREPFSMIWQQIEALHFKVMPQADESLVQAYVTQICG
jgi:hypothetical protein